jgi:hypothetical protein
MFSESAWGTAYEHLAGWRKRVIAIFFLMNNQTIGTLCLVSFDVKKGEIRLHAFTPIGQQYTFVVTDLDALIQSAQRAKRAMESQPAGVVLGRFDV